MTQTTFAEIEKAASALPFGVEQNLIMAAWENMQETFYVEMEANGQSEDEFALASLKSLLSDYSDGPQSDLHWFAARGFNWCWYWR